MHPEIIYPATLAHVVSFHQPGLQERVLNLLVLVALVLRMVWRQIGTVSELVKMLCTEGLL